MVEIVRGLGLFVGLSSSNLIPLGGIDRSLFAPLSAVVLLELAITIYQANSYIFTHGADLLKTWRWKIWVVYGTACFV